MSDEVEKAARRIAVQGREALLERLRPAFNEAAKAHSDVLTLDDEQLERMVQRAADRADGLQWRRALASVACDQLGIGLGEALGHPAVVRAQELAEAPSYEEALAAVSGGKAAESGPVESEAPSQPETPEEPDPVAEAEPEEADDEPEAPRAPDDEDDFEDPRGFGESPPIEPVTLKAVHLGGIAKLRNGAGDIELRFSRAGLDIARGDQPLGRLTWREITAVEAPVPAGRRRRRPRSDGTVVIRSANGSATFEIPGVTPEELQEQLAPLLEDQ